MCVGAWCEWVGSGFGLDVLFVSRLREVRKCGETMPPLLAAGSVVAESKTYET